jgi:hypothetical protein
MAMQRPSRERLRGRKRGADSTNATRARNMLLIIVYRRVQGTNSPKKVRSYVPARSAKANVRKMVGWCFTALITALLALTRVPSACGLAERDPSVLKKLVVVSESFEEFIHGFSRSATDRVTGLSERNDSSTCDTCKQVVLDLEDRLNDPQLQDDVVEFLLVNVCPMLPGDASRTCRQEARVVVAQIAASIQQMIDVDGLCVGLGACGSDDVGLPRSLAVDTSLGSPWYCHGLDCPYFTVLEKGDGYEKRRYVGGTWASTTVETYLYAVASPRGFKRLFNYIDEGNLMGIKIPMTSPVRVRMEPSCGAFCKQNFTVSFFLPKEYQSNPPPPLDESVFIEKDPPATYYVKSSGGFKMDDLSIAHMANSLAQELDEAGKHYDASEWFVAGYDPPFRLSDRHTEVWLRQAKDDPPHASSATVEARDASRDDYRDDECDICENVIEEVTQVVENPESQAEAIAYAKEGCAVVGGSLEEACDQVVDEFGPVLIEALVEALVGGEDVCVEMGYCSGY